MGCTLSCLRPVTEAGIWPKKRGWGWVGGMKLFLPLPTTLWKESYIWAGNAQRVPIYISPQISSQSSTIVNVIIYMNTILGSMSCTKTKHMMVEPTSLLDHWCIQRTKDLLGSRCQPVTKGLWNLTTQNHLHPSLGPSGHKGLKGSLHPWPINVLRPRGLT